MKTFLIIYPHWVPSNLAGVHRARLIANFLPQYNVKPIILTVHSDFYEEKLDWDMTKTVNSNIEVIYVKAKKIGKPRIIGDIGLRAFKYLKNKALEIIKTRQIDFLWVPIPSFYTAPLARILHNKTKIMYGIDYIDPWIRDISNRKTCRAVISHYIATILEPYSLRKASLISGVSELYYKPALNRNFKNKSITHIAMPYGFDPHDHQIEIKNMDFPWKSYENCIPFVYAGAFLPKSDLFANLLFKVINELKTENRWNKNIKLFFLGTGNYRHKSITEFAKKHKVESEIIEIRERFPFLHILNFLSAAQGVIVLGSTEPHYTASKTFQSLLSGKPVFSIFHKESSAIKVFEDCRADNFLCKFDEKESNDKLFDNIKQRFYSFINCQNYNPDLSKLDKYSAKKSAELLANTVNNIKKKQQVKKRKIKTQCCLLQLLSMKS